MNPTPIFEPAEGDSSIRRPRNLTLALVNILTGMIEDGQLKVGDKLPPEKHITQEHRVSRTVVREAISHLQSHGLVETRHGIGTFVVRQRVDQIDPQADRTLGDVMAVIELRIGIEVDSAGLAALRRTEDQLARMQQALSIIEDPTASRAEAAAADFEFHQQIALATDNRYFADITEHLGLTLIPRNRLNSAALANTAIEDYSTRLRQEHHDIYATIANRDSDGAKAAMRRHLSNIRERLRAAYERQGS
ncbi:FadR family transcriptional regulator [Pseudomonas sp. CDFA 553]|uniref:FadR/GntR family transcriptional regulator n=1 Tax=Pseudomonas quasicaspiana TaxID=2829821 RepID=UPI001E35FED8|nr:FadR/GntR family transcriptional regulator [Pseudomonas quasicaspiana]MCD5988913.1 FadR family transcriptional regulator [Pseudomonas quasicaspiana]